MAEQKLISPSEAHYTVYKLTDPAGKIYIGCTGKPVKERWGKGRRYSRDTPIRTAIDNLGWEAFDKQILCEKLTREGAEKLEKWFIARYDSANPEKGYNRFLGGLGKGARMSEGTKENCRKLKNRFYEEHPEVKEKLRSSVLAAYENDPDYRKRVSRGIVRMYENNPGVVEKISKSVKQLWKDPGYRRRATEGRAAIHNGNTAMAHAMQERGRQYYRDHPEMREKIAAKCSAYLLSPAERKFVESDSHAKPVRCVETGEVFRSQQAAERATGFCNIHKVCSGRNRTAGGYHWEYI